MAKSADQLEPTISTTELCERYRCDPRTIRRRAKEARVTGRKGGRERVYPLSEAKAIDEVMRRRSGELPPAAPEPTPATREAKREADVAAAARKIRRGVTKSATGRLRRLLPRDPKAKVVVLELARPAAR